MLRPYPSARQRKILTGGNRDPRRWEYPDRFDVARKASQHTAFGAGIHKCVDQMLARLETELMLAALLRRFATLRSRVRRNASSTIR
jgi:cytochrome P450